MDPVVAICKQQTLLKQMREEVTECDLIHTQLEDCVTLADAEG